MDVARTDANKDLIFCYRHGVADGRFSYRHVAKRNDVVIVHWRIAQQFCYGHNGGNWRLAVLVMDSVSDWRYQLLPLHYVNIKLIMCAKFQVSPSNVIIVAA